jgi:hypothetical protein
MVVHDVEIGSATESVLDPDRDAIRVRSAWEVLDSLDLLRALG